MIYAFDPGESTGYAIFEPTGVIVDMGQSRGFDALVEFLTNHNETSLKPSVVICEDYKVRPDRFSISINVGSKMETVQALGMLRGWAQGHKAKWVLQPPAVKRLGEQYSGFTYTGGHENSHQWDAYSHGWYYLVRNKIKNPVGLEGKEMV